MRTRSGGSGAGRGGPIIGRLAGGTYRAARARSTRLRSFVTRRVVAFTDVAGCTAGKYATKKTRAGGRSRFAFSSFVAVVGAGAAPVASADQRPEEYAATHRRAEDQH